MHYIIQENIFKEPHYNLLVETMERLELSYQLVRVYPFVDKIVELKDIPDVLDNIDDLPDIIVDRKDVFLFGSVKMARITANLGWKPGSQINENHDFSVYSKYYKENLLNYDSLITTFSTPLEWVVPRKFIRPTKDSKAFTGKVYSKEGWIQFVNDFKPQSDSILTLDTVIQVSSIKQIYKEIRFWVVNGKVITGSQYAIGGEVLYNKYFEPEAQEYAQSMVDIYQPADAFVIDVCLTENGWKVVEINCINCAGFYLCNMQKMIMELEYFFNKKVNA